MSKTRFTLTIEEVILKKIKLEALEKGLSSSDLITYYALIGMVANKNPDCMQNKELFHKEFNSLLDSFKK